MRDPYEVLGVAKDATADDIKSAFRRLARQHHPDVNPDNPQAEETFKEIGNAYAILSDPEKKARFDQFGAVEEQPGGFYQGGSFSDLFDMFFGGGGGGFSGGGDPRRADGEDVRADIEIGLAEVVAGAEREVRYRRYVRCTTCAGSGAADGSAPERCSKCGGTGAVRQVRETFIGTMTTSATCSQCRGAGTIIKNPCASCRGQGLVAAEATGTVTIPPGVRSGSTLHLPGRGSESAGYGRPGDLYVVIDVREDPRFERNGQELHAHLELTFAQAALGDEIVIEGVDSEFDLEVPAGTQPGTILTLRGGGLPGLHGGRRGDLHLHTTIRVPEKVTEAEAEIIRELADMRGERIPKPPENQGGLLGGLFKKKK